MPSRRGVADLSVFSEPLSSEAKYWIGFLMADGCVYGDHQKTTPAIKLSSNIRDETHIRLFASFMKLPMGQVKRFIQVSLLSGISEMVSVSFGSKVIAQQLKNFGVVPRKSLTARVSDSLSKDLDFWRGAIDGDGSLGIYKVRKYDVAYLTFCGSFQLVSQFADFVNQVISFEAKVKLRKKVYASVMTGKNCKKLVQLLYYPGSLALKRKLDLATQIIEMYR